MEIYFIGVDVGTSSARAGLFDSSGVLLGVAKEDIRVWKEPGDFVEQSSANIWSAVCNCVRQCVLRSGVDAASIAGIGFDATCSLVVLGPGGSSLAVGPSDEPDRNVIVWMDHRATEQANHINQLGSSVLNYVGGTISPEMETPKLLWLSEHKADTFSTAWQFMDLTDFLTWKASGSLARSTCTVTCKWTYLAHENRWDADYFHRIGIGALADEGFARIGTEIVPGGTSLAQGVTARAAAELGLRPGTAVAAGLIDAHAGGIGTVGASGGKGSVISRMAYVFGTSACTMTTTREPVFVSGIWGPYRSAMVPHLWLNEGGQSAAGAAIDHLVLMHPASPEEARRAAENGENLSAWLARNAEQVGGLTRLAEMVGSLHVVPELLGNRAPFADPDARAIIAGLSLDTSVESLIGLYLAGLVGLGYGVRQIIAAQASKGISVDTIVISGGAGQSPLVRQLLADTTMLDVAMTTSPEPVLLGSAMLGAVASKSYESLEAAMSAMSTIGDIRRPDLSMRPWHDHRFASFEALQSVGRMLTSKPNS